jgi:gamma-glutamyltranspeptidase/glutathione hydrolase
MADAAPAARGEAFGPHGAVACAHPLAAMAGIRTLLAGGNAIDAAVATAAALNVVEPNCSGLGGVGWMLIHHAASGRSYALDCVGPVPRDFAAALPDGARVHTGAASVVVPGNLAGWAAALERFGTRTLAQVLEPALEYAEQGFPVSRRLAGDLAEAAHAAPGVPWLPGGRLARVGEVLRVPELADTLRTIQAEGAGALYGGRLGRRVVEFIRSQGGFLRLEDLAEYRPRWVEPAAGSVFGRRVLSMPAPNMGPVVITALRVAEALGVGALEHNGPEHVHLLCEAFKVACRQQLRGDGEAAVGALADEVSRGDASPDPLLPRAPEGTTHLDVVDAEGNTVAFTTTIGSFWGCGLAVPGTGILLANILNWLDLAGGRPVPDWLSPATPCLVLGPGTMEVLAVGTPGGTGIPQTTLQVLAGHLGHGLPLQEALDRPRWRIVSNLAEAPAMRRWCTDGDLLMESRFPVTTVEALQQRAYPVRTIGPYSLAVGGFHAAGGRARAHAFWAAADPRRGGAGLAW